MLKVTDVEYMGDYSLLCWFNNGEKKYVDLEPLLKYPMFEELKDKKRSRHCARVSFREWLRMATNNGIRASSSSSPLIYNKRCKGVTLKRKCV